MDPSPEQEMLTDAYTRHLGGPPSPQFAEIAERIARALRREAIDEWGLIQPRGNGDMQWMYDRYIGPSMLMQRVLDEHLRMDDYTAIARTTPIMSDRQKLLGEFAAEEIADMSDEEVITRNSEAFFIDVMWSVWDDRFGGDKLVVVGVSALGPKLLDLMDPLTHDAINQERFGTAGYYTNRDYAR